MDAHHPTPRGHRFVGMSGKTFGQWSVIGEAKRRGRALYWTCRCTCGTVSEVAGGALRAGRSSCCTSCRSVTHGKSTTPEYIAWRAMRSRCQVDTNRSHRNYGGRGIAVCPEWTSFEAFYRDMGPRPTPKHTIERGDNNRGYCKENCRWATRPEQLRNTRRTRIVTFNGVTQCATDWATQLGMPSRTLLNRLSRGWSVERALTEPVH